MPPNQKHTRAFTYEPQRIAQECIKRQGERTGEQATPLLPFLSTSYVTALFGGGISGGVCALKVIRAEDQKHRIADAKPFLAQRC